MQDPDPKAPKTGVSLFLNSIPTNLHANSIGGKIGELIKSGLGVHVTIALNPAKESGFADPENLGPDAGDDGPMRPFRFKDSP